MTAQVKLEIEGTVYEGETIKEARNAYRRAQAKHRKLESAKDAAAETAKMRAEVNGYRILARLAEGKIPRGWSIARRGETQGPTIEWDYELSPLHGKGTEVSVFYTESARGRWYWATPTVRVLGVLRDGTGSDRAVFVESSDGFEAFAIGTAEYTVEGKVESVTRLVDLPGVSMERIEQAKERKQ